MQRLPRYALKSGFGWGLGLSLALSGLGAGPAQAQYKLPAPVLPPATGTLPAPIQAAPPQAPLPVLVPVNPSQANSIVVSNTPDAESRTAALTAPLLITQWRAQKSTPQEAWDKGTLTVEDLIYILNHSIDYWGGFYWEKDVDLRRAIVALLVQHGGDKIAKPQTLSPFVRLWLADYYESIGDERTLPLCEGILSEIKAPIKGENALAFQAIERIGWYDRDKGQYEQGAQAWSRMMNYHADVGWWTPDSIMEAARLKMRAGDVKQAQELYAQVPKYGNDWLNSMVLADQATISIADGNYQAALKLLQHTVSGSGADETAIPALSLIAYCYYRMGDYPTARQYCNKALAQFKAMRVFSQKDSLEIAVASSENCLHWIEQWNKAPLACEPSSLHILTGWKNGQYVPKRSITRHLTVRSAQPASLNIVADQPGITSSILDDTDKDAQFFFTKEVVIEIAPELLQKNLTATLSISSAQSPNFHLCIPLQIEVQGVR